MKHLKVAEIANILNTQSNSHCVVKGAAVDSRLVEHGQLFFALPGAQVDGHQFLGEACAKGAVAAVVNHSYKGPDFGLPLLYVESPLKALQDLARYVHSTRKCKVVSVTGSLGKTSTKEFIATLLAQKYRVGRSPGNSNSQIGVPLSILNHASNNDEVLVLEMGMTHPGQIEKLVGIAPPDVAIITTVAWVHGINFKSLAEIAKAKAEIFSHPHTSMGIMNGDIQDFDLVYNTGRCPKITFSSYPQKGDYSFSQQKDPLIVIEKGECIELGKWTLLGEHLQTNLLGAIATARYLGLDWDQIRNGFQQLTLPERRMELVEKKGVLFLNDSYNAAEPSLKAALKSLPAPKEGGKKIGVIGEMLELGHMSDQCHASVGEYALDYVDHVLCLGKGCKPIEECWKKNNRPVQWFLDRNELLCELKKEVKPGDVVLLKGSRSNGLWKILEDF